MRANVGVTAELLSAFGVPAVQQGNVIEVATGAVGIDDACSGIRSLQATLMISLFLGELCGLAFSRRLWLVLSGFVLAFVFNVGRTLLLTAVASAKGVGAVASWHDPAGVTILIGCFLSLWLLAWLLRDQRSEIGGHRSEVTGPSTLNFQPSTTTSPRPSTPSAFSLQPLALALLAWFLVVEAGTCLWYRSHEWRVAKATTWHVEFPRGDASFRELPFSDKTRQFLRYDEGGNGTWQEGADQRWQAVFLRWNPGSIAVHLAKSHTPEVCLTAAGRELLSQLELRAFFVHGLRLPFRSYVIKDESGPVHVFYCLWEDRSNAQSFGTTRMSYANRLAPVLAGRRNSGQRSLEVAISGIAGQGEADVALTRELETLIKVDK
jgi:exosortase/archaeosortase family protein